MKNNSASNLKHQIPQINFPDTFASNYKNKKAKTIESTFKSSKSSQNVFSNKYDATISLINRQSSNIQLHNPSVLTIPAPVRSKHCFFKKQSVFAFDIISQYQKSLKEENIELRESIKFLLKQIKKLKQMRASDENHCYHKELFSKLTHELETIKSQLKDKEDIFINLKENYDNSSKENQVLKQSILHKRMFDLNALLPENKEQIEYDCIKKAMGLNDLSSTIFSLNADNNITNISSFIPNSYNASNTAFYVKKTGLGGHKKKKSGNILETSCLLVQPIIEKKLIMKKSYNCLYTIMSEENITGFNISDKHFSSIDYIDTCNFHKKIKDKEVITLNALNGLYILSGEDCNQLFYFDSSNNTMKQLEDSLFSHWKGAMILYTNYLSEVKLICLCSNTHTKVEMYHVDNSKWSELPQMNNHNDILSRVDTGYLLLNNHYIAAFYGYDYIRNKYIESIDFLSLSNPTKWEEIPLKNRLDTNIFMKNHTVFKLKNETSSESQYIFLLGGSNEKGPNASLMEINLKCDLSEYSPIINQTQEDQEHITYSFTSSLYDYIQPNQNYPYKKIIKYAFDCNSNIHIIGIDEMSHDILSYSFEGNWN